MREFKFRVWDKVDGMKHFDLSDYVHVNHGVYDVPVMQYTGLKDKNGTEIYEGDVLLQGMFNILPYEVKWNSLGWSIINKHHNYSGWVPESTEVIGNIYENKELINHE